MIPYGKQQITQADINAVVEVLQSDFLTQGPVIKRFEDSIAKHTAAKHCLAVNSATSALHIACMALGVGKDDIVWTSPISFVASSNCALYCGAKVDFVDIDPKTYNLCPQKLEEKLIAAKKNNCLPKVVIPVHLSGQSCNMLAINKLAKQYGFKVLEDASHAIGASYNNKPVGSCQYSDICVFSFHPVKIITTAEGGAATTNSPALAAKMERLRSHGVTRDETLYNQPSHGGWYYQQLELGYNYRLTELQAALGLSQMQRLESFIETRQNFAKFYDQELASISNLVTPFQLPKAVSSYHLYIIQLTGAAKANHAKVFAELRQAGLGVNLHYIPIHLQPYYTQLGFKEGDFPNSENYYKGAISIPLFHGLTKEQSQTVVNTLKQTLAKYE